MDLENHPYLVPNIFLFAERKCYPDWKITKSKISFHDLTFVVEGKATYYINEQKFTVEAGDVVYVPGGSIREAHTFKECPMYAYPFNFYWSEPHNHIHLPFGTVTKKGITKEILGYLREFHHTWERKQPYHLIQARAIFELILHRLLSDTYRHSTTLIDLRVKKMTALIENHYSEEITIHDLAAELNLHPVYLGKLFKNNMGTTYKEYLHRVRINHAENMLSSGNFNVSEVAERTGFQDLSYFSKVFKSLKGYPPSAVKKQ